MDPLDAQEEGKLSLWPLFSNNLALCREGNLILWWSDIYLCITVAAFPFFSPSPVILIQLQKRAKARGWGEFKALGGTDKEMVGDPDGPFSHHRHTDEEQKGWRRG